VWAKPAAGINPELGSAEGLGETGGDEAFGRVVDFFFEWQLAAAGGGVVTVATLVGGDAEKPGAEVAALKVRDGAEGGDKGLLGGVIGGVEVAGETEAEIEDTVLVKGDQTLVGGAVTGDRGPDIAFFV
jgi:hypothetical protein